ncbi:restriction endonuclease subunit S [Massilia sp. DWR3-1-1]|uniref:restriction endonuclease subunit S n=1 Tax=Massilia sp. DWR3-1-1 TaxID=2804559 RepID=UPI003CEEA3C3
MTFKPYPKYKASGVEWLGDVPEGWSVAPLKRTVAMTNEKIQAKDTAAGYVGMENIESWSGKFVESASDFEAEGLSNGFDVGDVLFGKLRPYLAKAWLSDRTGVCSSELLVLRPKNVVAQYLLHQVLNRDFVALVDSSTYGSKMPRASWDYIGGIELPVPPICDQVSITIFLDRETAKIDTLIAKQEAMIGLLKEKRQAVISHAVTKGLDPSVPMKASGVEWLGDVPEHWNTTRLKFVASFITSGPRGWSEYLTDEGPIFLQSGDLNDELGIDFRLTKRVTPPANAEGRRTTLNELDIVVCITGANTGRVAVVVGIPCAAFINQHLALVRPMHKTVSPKFLAYLLASDIGRTYFEVSQYGLKEGLSLSAVSEAPIPSLPLDEQNSIVAFIDMTTAKIDTLIAKAQQAIVLQKEHRTALISAAVTGKIDVLAQATERKAA